MIINCRQQVEFRGDQPAVQGGTHCVKLGCSIHMNISLVVYIFSVVEPHLGPAIEISILICV